jgi:hypothetical protein
MKQFSSSVLALSIAAALLSGCASQSIVLPSAAGLADADVVVLKIDKTIHTGGLRPELNNLYDITHKTEVLPSKGFHDYYKIKVAPGDYAVGLKTYSAGYSPSFPYIKIRALAGMTYLFTASVVMNGQATRADYRIVPTSEDRTPE